MTATGATGTGNMLVLTIDVERLHGCSAEHPFGHKTPVGQCQMAAIGFPDGGTVLRMDGQTSDYRVEVAAPGGAELIAAILANAKPFPPGMVIVPAADVVSPELRAAIYLVCRFINSLPFESKPCEVQAAADLISALGSTTDTDYSAFLDATGRYEGQLT